MTRIRQETRLELDKRDLLALCAGVPQTIVCRTGELWITFDGRQEDVILRAGARLELDGRRGVVLSALQPATLSLAAHGASGGACRLTPAAAALAWARRLRWQFPALASFPASRLF